MTKTLQEKIDAVFKYYASRSKYEFQTNKAIQELREEIENLFERNMADEIISSPCNSELDRVLALIGEKKGQVWQA